MTVKTRNQVSGPSPVMRRITRSSVQAGIFSSSSSEVDKPSSPSKKTKKVKFLDPAKETSDSVNKNNSLISDEGIDMSFSPSSLLVPQSISRPQHKLQHPWTMWFSPRNKKLSWTQNQLQVCSMATVEDFWHCYNQVKLASKLPAGHTYAVFKKGIIPDWEDKANVQGGRWMIYYDKMERHHSLDDRWMEALLMVLGDHLDQIVTGVQICIRGKFDRIEVWLGKTSKMSSVAEIGRKLKKQLGEGAAKLEFSIHMEEKEGLKGPCLMI